MSQRLNEGMFKKAKNNNKGMALVTVIVVIGFVAALVSIVLTTSLVNFKMKSVNTKSKDTFYSAEQALDEINVYLQKVVSDSMSSAYLDIMNNYSTYDSQKKTELLETKYYENIWAELGVVDGSGIHREKYDVSKLENWLKPTTIWHQSVDADGGFYGAIVVADVNGAESKEGKMVTYENSGVVLEGLKVYYKDERGFVSVVKTDIRLSYPQFDFAASSELPSLPYYSIIADEQAIVESKSTLNLSGNVYANQLTVNGGIKKQNPVIMTTGSGDSITVKYDIDIQPYSKITTGSDTEMWAKNVIVDTSSFEIDGTLQVANDLNLKGTNPTAKISGEYVGFGNSLTDSEYSSAILINGEGSTLDLSGLEKLTVAGHSFIGAKQAEYPVLNSFTDNNTSKYPTFTNEEIDKARDLVTAKNSDFMMGESLAVKSDQLMYLVPAEAIGVDTKTGKTSAYSKNPLTFKEYDELMKKVKDETDEFDYVEVASDVTVGSLGTDLSIYLATKVLGEKVVPNVQKVFVRVSDENAGGGLVYFYMKFSSVTKAEKFFTAYYNNNRELVQKYMNFYLDDVDVHKFDSLTTVANAGPVLVGDKDDEDGYDIEIGRQASDSDYMQKIHDKYYDKYKALCKSLVSKDDGTNSSLKPISFAESFDKDVSANQVVFENLISEALLEEFVDKVPSNGVMYNTEDAADASLVFYNNTNTIYIFEKSDYDTNNIGASPLAIISKGDIATTITNSTKYDKLALVITKGDVAVEKTEFKGLILSDGKVYVKADNAVIAANPGEVRKVLGLGYINKAESDNAYTVARVLREGNEFIYSTLDPKGDTANLALGGLISYENWSKE